MTQKLDNLHHIAIQVKDIAQSVKWYTEKFTCNIAYQDESWAMLKFENTHLALVLPEQHPYHFAIIEDNLEKFGTPVPHRDGTSSIYIKDIDGNNVELLKLADED